MNYLTPEIEAFSKKTTENTLVRPTVSCGIFQDYKCNEMQSASYFQQEKKV